jgi:hypothetical protein
MIDMGKPPIRLPCVCINCSTKALTRVLLSHARPDKCLPTQKPLTLATPGNYTSIYTFVFAVSVILLDSTSFSASKLLEQFVDSYPTLVYAGHTRQS